MAFRLGFGLGIGYGALSPEESEGPVDLIVNGGFDSGDNWVATHSGGGTDAVIAGGVASFDTGTQGNQQNLTQTLAGGSSPAGSYTFVCDKVPVPGWESAGVQVALLGASDEVRGSQTFGDDGAGIGGTVSADGEVSKIRLRDPLEEGDYTIDNVQLFYDGP